MCAIFNSETGNAHCMHNETSADVLYLEVGDHTGRDSTSYPDDDRQAAFTEDGWRFAHKDRTPY